MKQKKIALVLSGGGARGLAHIGVIEELLKNGYEISSIAGTSMGALIGGVYALGKLEEYKEWMYSLDKLRIFNMVDFTLSKQGLVKGEKVLHKMQDFIPDSNIEDLEIPYAAVAVDILSGEEMVFRSGSIYEAIRASIAVPTVFTPVEYGDKLLVDGGVLNNIPVDHVERSKRDLLIAVNVNANIAPLKLKDTPKEEDQKEKAYQKKIREFQSHLKSINPLSGDDKLGYFDLLNRTIATMTYHIAHMNLETHTPDLLINVSRQSCGMFDFFKAEEMVEIGRIAAIEALKDKR